jgi:ferric-dicitrate binding protein FerR (iron transport regulator)
MTDTKHEDHNAYLWDRSAPVDADAVAIEHALGDLKFTPGTLPASAFRNTDTRYRFSKGLLLAASLLLATGVGVYFWRLSWPTDRPWTVTQGSTQALAVGATLQTRAAEEATVNIARIGTMTVGESTSVSLGATASARHRLDMSRGAVDVRVWAPPGRFVVRTPVGDVIDLGCVFRLEVDAGVVTLHVQSGWVLMDNGQGESLTPAGASSSMTAGRQPRVPVYDDALPGFEPAVRQWEDATDPAARAAFVATVTAQARARDVLTLLMLAVRTSGPDRAAFVTRAAALAPPPSSVSVTSVVTGDNDALWRWRESLPLPPTKSWWRNWPDAFSK